MMTYTSSATDDFLTRVRDHDADARHNDLTNACRDSSLPLTIATDSDTDTKTADG